MVTMRTMDLSVIWEYGVWFSGSILYFPFFMESFVIGFIIVEFHQLLSQKKKNQASSCGFLIRPNEKQILLKAEIVV
jgi:hypothetical protein